MQEEVHTYTTTTTWILFLLHIVAYSGHTFVVVVVPNISGGMLLHKMFICTAVHLPLLSN